MGWFRAPRTIAIYPMMIPGRFAQTLVFVSFASLQYHQLTHILTSRQALVAQSEQEIVVNSDLCPGESSDYMSQIRSDFTVCALPADSLAGSCISGAENEPDECGFGPNVMGLCGFCASNSPNSTDSCCTNANAASRCKDVTVPTTTASLPPIIPSSTSNSTAGGGGSSDHDYGLSGGQIAGAVVGSVAGFAILVALAVFILLLRRRRRAESDSGLNQPNPQRKGFASMQSAKNQPPFSSVPGGRVTRLAALREMPSLSSRRSPGLFGGLRNKRSDVSSEGTSASPGRMSKRIPPTTGKRKGSLTSSSFLATSNDTSPHSGTNGQHSSPGGMSSGTSEQLSTFQDYYSHDSIHPGDRVAVLWAYQPRAGDEFSLDRGEMLKVIGIWDDGWATGVRVPDTADSYDIKHREQRDSGVSNGSHKLASPVPTGEIKAFPMVCVCLPQHWRAIIDGAGAGKGA